MRPLDHARINESLKHLVRQPVAAGKVDHFHRGTVDRISEEKQIKVGAIGIRVNTRLGELDGAERFNIAKECSHDETPFTSRK